MIVSHGDENLDVPDLGMIAAIDGSQTGDIKTYKWAQKGDAVRLLVARDRRQPRVPDRERLASARLRSRHRHSQLWQQQLGTIQKAPLVLADGKLYVGTESGKFFIVRPGPDKAEILSEVEMPMSTDENAGQTARYPGADLRRRRDLARPHLLRLERCGVYAIGAKKATAAAGWAVDEPRPSAAKTPATWLQVVSDRGRPEARRQTVRSTPALFDAKGRVPSRGSAPDVVR